ncbi:MAG TPA: type II toxin-antitoxin system HicA family toxin [Rhodothermales bacterium]|nr:type II toxin-antitoxin system HicA family toxin [Rhodothermales bacterium]
MRVPRNLDGSTLINRLRKLGYEPMWQSGSHVRLTRRSGEQEHHVTVPLTVRSVSARRVRFWATSPIISV